MDRKHAELQRERILGMMPEVTLTTESVLKIVEQHAAMQRTVAALSAAAGQEIPVESLLSLVGGS